MKNILNKNDTVIVGVSGGPDSMYLINLCLEFRASTPIIIVIAHVNHNLRGKESDKDAEFVEKFAKKNGIKFELKSLKKIKKGNLEEKCREERYEFFEKLRLKHNAKWILTAHHMEDNVETIIFNFIRGTSLSGLRGIEYCSKERHLLRPILNVRKEKVLAYLKKNKIRFMTDSTNADTDFSRNLIRHKIIPEMEKINPNFVKTLGENLVNFRELEDYMKNRTIKWLAKNKNGNRLPLDKFLSLEPALQKSVLAFIYKDIHGNTNKFNQNHLKQILKVIRQKAANKKKEFGDGHFMEITKNENNLRNIEINMTGH